MAIELGVDDNNVFRRFAADGYLPEVLPPIFTSSPFADHCGRGGILIEPPKGKLFDRISYSCTKRGHSRRLFNVMHPVSVAFASGWLSSHWNSVSAYCNEPDSTAAKLTLCDEFGGRAIKTPSFDIVQREAKSRSARARHIVKADIAKFYPSIYTHSIAWALHGKDVAKAHTDANDSAHYANRLDWALRLGQSGQTIGVPIGSDISRVTAEILGSAIDRIVKEKSGSKIIGYVRNIDDFHIGCNSLSDAEAILAGLSTALREFELSLNDEKTQIIAAHDLYDDDWAIELDSFLASNAGNRKKVISRAFDRTFLYASKNKADSSVKFLVRLVDKEIAADLIDFSDVEHDLVRSFVNFPHCIDYVLTLLMVQSTKGPTADQWDIALNDELARHATAGHDHEICWLLCAMFVCGINLTAVSCLGAITNPLCVCLIYLLAEDGLLSANLNDLFLPQLRERQAPSNWIVVHEGLRRGWFKRDEVGYDYREGIETVLPDAVSFLQGDIVDEFSMKPNDAPSIPDRYLRYDEASDDGYIEYLVRRQMERDAS